MKWNNIIQENMREALESLQGVFEDLHYNVDAEGKVVPTHSAIVIAVDQSGYASQCISKWGQLGVYIHAPRDVPAVYCPDAPTMTVNGKVYPTRVYYRHN